MALLISIPSRDPVKWSVLADGAGESAMGGARLCLPRPSTAAAARAPSALLRTGPSAEKVSKCVEEEAARSPVAEVSQTAPRKTAYAFALP